MKLIHAKLPDGERLEYRALATVVAPHQQIELREIVDLFADALEIAQGQSGNHSGIPFSPDFAALAACMLMCVTRITPL